MDDVVHQLAHELAEAIGSRVSGDPKVEACRKKARAAGYEMQISLEAIIGFGSCDGSQTLAKVAAPTKKADKLVQPTDITANDRRFLRSLRISPDEINQEVE